jgi:formylglycine-generating enzyme
MVAASACGRVGFGATNEAQPGVDAPDEATVVDAISIDAMPSPSCVDLAPTCGPSGSLSCCGSPLVPGGSFDRSYDLGSDNMFSDTSFPATVSDFRLDRYEVTVGRFRQFVAAGMGTMLSPPADNAGAHADIAASGWDPDWTQYLMADSPTLIAGIKCNPDYQSWTDTAGANENLPMNCITWYEAFAFCAWDAAYMPTETEWNYAAAGGTDQRAYPWSSPANALDIDCTYANYDPAAGYCVNAPTGGLLRVGSYSPQSDGKWGQADLAGSLWEKVLDTYETPYALPSCDNCADLTSPDARTVRGGAFNADAPSARGANRYYDPPTVRYIEMGVRCARMP